MLEFVLAGMRLFDRYALAPLLTLLLLTTSSFSAQVEAPDRRLVELVDEYFEEFLVLNPVLATFNGDHRFDDRFTVGISPDVVERSRELDRVYLQKVEAIEPVGLTAANRLTRDLFLRERRQALNGAVYPGELIPVNQFHSAPIVFAMLGAGGSIQPFDSVRDYDNWLARMNRWVPWFDQAIANMRRGIEAGVVQPEVIVRRTLPVLDRQVVKDPRDSDFYGPIRRMPSSIPVEQRERIEREYVAAIGEHVVPAYRRLHAFLRDEYLPKARATVGLSALPNGREWYAHLVRVHTTTDLTPGEIHRLGLAEVKRIQREIDRVQGEKQTPESAMDYGDGRLLEGYRSLRRIVEDRLPELFQRIPRADFEIRPVEEFRRRTSAGASYMAGSPDGSRKGVFYVNASESARGTPSEALFLHEALPGHHFQISLQRELDELPRFRRYGNYTAFSEGWGLYAERLGTALGLYRTRGQRIRALQSEMFRARRLVVDTGLHAMGWSRRRAIDYIGATNEVDRYIVMPGQALAYKVGQLQLLKLRDRAREKLGDRFNVRDFHRIVLEEGAMPLDVLESRINDWIAASRKAG